MPAKPPTLLLRTALATLALLVVAVVAWAMPPYQDELFARYPSASTSLQGCVACHNGGPDVLTSFGEAFRDNGLAFDEALEALDSDGDGVPNGDELNASPASNPGDAASKPGSAPPPSSNPPTPATPAAGTGAALYATHCASCHGPLASSGKSGASLSRVQGAIAAGTGGMGYLSSLSGADVQAIVAALAPSTAAGAGGTGANYTGMWWNPAESGWGLNVAHQGSVIFVTLFTYDATGTPMWAFMTGQRQADGKSFAGDLTQARGSAFDALPFRPLVAKDITVAGTMTVTFTSDTSARVTYTYNGASVAKDVVPQVFGTAAATCAFTSGSRAALVNYQDLWWNPSESGWGLNVVHQDNVIFATLFTYDASGRDLWLMMAAGKADATGAYTGDLYSVRGPAFDAKPFTPITAADVTKVGTMKLAFADGANGTLSYSYNGTAVSKSITRQVFASTTVACTHPGSTATAAAAGNDGAALYARYCASCHGALASSGKGGATSARIGQAIAGNVGGMGTLSTLSASQVQAIAASLSGTAAPPPGTAPACGSCHAIPPASGVHPKHDARFGCESCHEGASRSAPNAATHNDGVRNVAAGAGWNAATQSCSNGCHGTASWTAGATLACTSCHGVPPASGDHVKHDARFSCATCHGGGYSVSSYNPATHNNGVRNTEASIGWNAAANTCTNACHGTSPWTAGATVPCGSCHAIPPTSGVHPKHDVRYACDSCHGAGYSRTGVAAATHNDGVRNVAAGAGWNAATQSCSNGCHGTASWTAGATLACTSCHGVPPASGDHVKHDARFSCATCHGGGYSVSSYNPATHNNGVRNTEASIGWNAAANTCTNACHGTSPWTAGATLPCGSCHAIPPPSGVHPKHDVRYACDSCHGAGYSRTGVAAATHNNGTRDVASTIGWNAAAKTCASACHAGGTWTVGATLACDACHGVPPSSGLHAKHDVRYACDSCHGTGYSRTGVVTATHINGVAETASAIGWNAAAKSCTSSCHTGGTWSAGATLACNACHAMPPTSGRHGKHASKNVACATCHGAGYTTTTVVAATHLNGAKEVVASTGWNATSRSCSNSCHGKETW